MAWVPIAESGVLATWEFVDAGAEGQVSLTGSNVVADGNSTTWAINSYDLPGLLRVTAVEYSTGPILTPARFWESSSGNETPNTSPTPTTQWLPSPMEFDLESEGAQVYYYAADFEGAVSEQFTFLLEVWQDDPPPSECNYNCECEDEYPTRTLAQMREFMMIRLGWAAMKDTPLPGVNDTLNAFLQDAQDQLHAEYRVPRLERFFTWNLQPGVRFYDLAENSDVCTKELDPRQLTWVGISEGCDAWRKLVCGIPPESYYANVSGIPSRYEIRQCIEVWPAPEDDTRQLRIKGYFYNEALVADTDVASIDYQAVQLYALANAKAHYGQQDAANVMRQAMRYIGNMTAGAHHTRRYVPGADERVAPPLPVLTGYPGDP